MISAKWRIDHDSYVMIFLVINIHGRQFFSQEQLCQFVPVLKEDLYLVSVSMAGISSLLRSCWCQALPALKFWTFFGPGLVVHTGVHENMMLTGAQLDLYQQDLSLLWEFRAHICFVNSTKIISFSVFVAGPQAGKLQLRAKVVPPIATKKVS
jgi:hypothetical protein